MGAVLLVGRADVQREQVAQGVDRQMDLVALLALGSIVARSGATLGRASQRAAVQDGGARILLAPLLQT
jgi:hypothetical protein